MDVLDVEYRRICMGTRTLNSLSNDISNVSRFPAPAGMLLRNAAKYGMDISCCSYVNGMPYHSEMYINELIPAIMTISMSVIDSPNNRMTADDFFFILQNIAQQNELKSNPTTIKHGSNPRLHIFLNIKTVSLGIT